MLVAVMTAVAPGDSVAAARGLLASLDPAAQKAIALPRDAPDRHRWRRDPSPRPGVALKA
jgi:hypothetical protein